MEHIPAPKLLNWASSIPQHYQTDKSILLTNGCSFTASTNQLECAASWPGFVVDRCGFDHGIDWSYPGVGNEYIGNSIINHLNNTNDIGKYFVIVMWSGLDRTTRGLSVDETVRLSADKIFEVYNYLIKRNIPFGFSFYCNLLFPPYIPKRDSSPNFEQYLDKTTLKKIRDLPWIPREPMDFMFEFGFKHDLLAEDFFHPNLLCTEKWTDEILLPGLFAQNLIRKIA